MRSPQPTLAPHSLESEFRLRVPSFSKPRIRQERCLQVRGWDRGGGNRRRWGAGLLCVLPPPDGRQRGGRCGGSSSHRGRGTNRHPHTVIRRGGFILPHPLNPFPPISPEAGTACSGTAEVPQCQRGLRRGGVEAGRSSGHSGSHSGLSPQRHPHHPPRCSFPIGPGAGTVLSGTADVPQHQRGLRRGGVEAGCSSGHSGSHCDHDPITLNPPAQPFPLLPRGGNGVVRDCGGPAVPAGAAAGRHRGGPESGHPPTFV